MQALDTQVLSLISEDATATAVVKVCQHHLRVTAHRSLRMGNHPGDHLNFHVSELLTLLDVARFRLPPAEFTFFLAGYTAALSGVSLLTRDYTSRPPHSGIHSAVMQYSVDSEAW